MIEDNIRDYEDFINKLDNNNSFMDYIDKKNNSFQSKIERVSNLSYIEDFLEEPIFPIKNELKHAKKFEEVFGKDTTEELMTLDDFTEVEEEILDLINDIPKDKLNDVSFKNSSNSKEYFENEEINNALNACQDTYNPTNQISKKIESEVKNQKRFKDKKERMINKAFELDPKMGNKIRAKEEQRTKEKLNLLEKGKNLYEEYKQLNSKKKISGFSEEMLKQDSRITNTDYLIAKTVMSLSDKLFKIPSNTKKTFEGINSKKSSILEGIISIEEE